MRRRYGTHFTGPMCNIERRCHIALAECRFLPELSSRPEYLLTGRSSWDAGRVAFPTSPDRIAY